MPKTIKTGILYRGIELTREHIDEDSRVIKVSFSSEEPVDRWFGKEILDHNADSVRMDRMRNGAAVLVDHDTSDHVGVVEDVSIDADRRGRAVLRLGKSKRAKEIFKDVLDGIRRHISVGYRVYRMVLEEESEAGDKYRVNDWEPYEISFVSVPADATVGVGRGSGDNFETVIIEERKMSEKSKDVKPADPVVTPAIDIDAEREQARSAEKERIRTITAIGDKFENKDLAREFVDSGKSADDFNRAMLDSLGKPVVTDVPDGDIGLNEKETRAFSFIRAINAMANPNDRRAQEAAAFERECSDAAAKRTGKTPQGYMIPADVIKRDLNVGTATAGGHTVATDLLSGSFIDVLRNRLAVEQLGATMLTDLNGDIAIPRQTSGATAYWVAESGAPTESQAAFDQVTLSPKTVGAFSDYSRKLLIQSSIAIEAFIRNDLARVMGLEIDRVTMYGSGASNQPTGIANTSGLGAPTAWAAAVPTFAEVVAMESNVASNNADIGTLGYLIEAAMRGSLKTTEKASGTAQFIWETGNTVNGYKTAVSNQAVSGDMFFGNWADVMIAFWSGLDLMVDPYTGSTSGTIRVVALQDCDIALRHPESMALGNDTP